MITKHVLIIEDEAELRKLLARHLTSRGLSVLEAENGTTGLSTALDKQPDLVLLDLHMPEMSGYQVLKKLRSESAWGKTVPVIILTDTPMNSEHEREEIEPLHPLHYIIKAMADPEDVFQKIQSALLL
ncbi:response regulator [bacterium]|nr:response regulator [bacterium]